MRSTWRCGLYDLRKHSAREHAVIEDLLHCRLSLELSMEQTVGLGVNEADRAPAGFSALGFCKLFAGGPLK
jgi:hypothetical protein